MRRNFILHAEYLFRKNIRSKSHIRFGLPNKDAIPVFCFGRAIKVEVEYTWDRSFFQTLFYTINIIQLSFFWSLSFMWLERIRWLKSIISNYSLKSQKHNKDFFIYIQGEVKNTNCLTLIRFLFYVICNNEKKFMKEIVQKSSQVYIMNLVL